jgi:hypothetical protein
MLDQLKQQNKLTRPLGIYLITLYFLFVGVFSILFMFWRTAATDWGMKSFVLLVNILIFSLCYGLLRPKEWARKSSIQLSVLGLIMLIYLHITSVRSMTQWLDIGSPVMYVVFIWYFSRASIKQYFLHSPGSPDPGRIERKMV